jgi:hypothetical protein
MQMLTSAPDASHALYWTSQTVQGPGAFAVALLIPKVNAQAAIATESLNPIFMP